MSEAVVVAVLVVQRGVGQDPVDAAAQALARALSGTDELLSYTIRTAEPIGDDDCG
jgi:hypothetical protein